MSRYNLLITAEQLLQLHAEGAPLMVFDVSFDLGQPELADAMFAQQRIAGAVQAHLDRDLSAHDAARAVNGGRHPLPQREAFAAWLGDQGFRNDMQAVVYDRNGNNFCGRLWWMLKWAGHEAVAVLDGGLQAWLDAGGATESGPHDNPRTPATFTLGAPLRRMVQTADVRALLEQDQAGEHRLIDSRGAPRYRGEVEPLDPIAGHIPGALNRPFTENFTPDGRFKPAQVLQQEWAAVLGDRPAQELVVYCGSGVSAVPNLIALELAGHRDAALYAGSWSEWSRTPGLPCETGDAKK